MYNSAVNPLLVDRCIAARTRLLGRLVAQHFERRLRPVGITVAQLDLLATILAAGGTMRPTDIAIEIGLDASTVTRNVARLQSSGFVTAEPGGSGRETTVRLTDDGLRATRRATAAWQAAQADVRSRIGPDGEAALDLLVSRLVK